MFESVRLNVYVHDDLFTDSIANSIRKYCEDSLEEERF